MKVKSLSRVQLFATPWTVAYQVPLSMGFPRQSSTPVLEWVAIAFSSRGYTYTYSCTTYLDKFHLLMCTLPVRRRQWHPTPVLLPGKFHGRRSLVGCSPWGREELDTTERLHFHFSLSCIGEGNGNPLQCSCLENPRDGGAW